METNLSSTLTNRRAGNKQAFFSECMPVYFYLISDKIIKNRRKEINLWKNDSKRPINYSCIFEWKNCFRYASHYWGRFFPFYFPFPIPPCVYGFMAQKNLAECIERIFDMLHELFRISHFLSPPFFPVGGYYSKYPYSRKRIGIWVMRVIKAKMIELLTAKNNVEWILGVTEKEKNCDRH